MHLTRELQIYEGKTERTEEKNNSTVITEILISYSEKLK